MPRFLKIFRWKPVRLGGWAMLCALVLSGCGKTPPPQRPPVSVTTAVAQTQEVPLYIDEIGNCLALQSVSIVPQVSGAVTQIHFLDGADVKSGDLLYTIDPRTYQAARDKAAATLAADQATLKLNQAQLDRSQNLVAGNYISPQDLENLKTVVATNEATVKQDKALLDTAEINLDYCTIRSPIDGKTGAHLVDIGNVVTAYANGPLVSIQRNNPLYVDFIVAETDLPRVREYFVHGSLKVEVYFPEDERKHRTSELFFLDNAVQTGSGTVKLRAILPNEDRLFWPGQFVKVKLILAQLPNAVVVPYGAVQVGHDGPFVFVAKPDNTVELRQVEIGQRQGNNIVISKGVAANETVVLTGQLLLSPGAKIVNVEPSTASPANSASADSSSKSPSPLSAAATPAAPATSAAPSGSAPGSAPSPAGTTPANTAPGTTPPASNASPATSAPSPSPAPAETSSSGDGASAAPATSSDSKTEKDKSQ